MSRKWLTALIYGLPALAIASVMVFTIVRPIQVLPRIGVGPGYGMIDTEDDWLTNERVRGKVVLYNFTYTHCESLCPRLMEKMQEVQQRLDEVELENLKVELVTITIDPERDTPEVMAEYAAQYKDESLQPKYPWHFLTSDSPEQTKIMVTSGFDLYYEKEVVTGSDNYQFDFVPMVVLIDGWGIIRAEYRQYEPSERLSFSEGRTDIDPDVILRDIGLIATETMNSEGIANVAYEAAHLFACYPP